MIPVAGMSPASRGIPSSENTPGREKWEGVVVRWEDGREGGGVEE